MEEICFVPQKDIGLIVLIYIDFLPSTTPPHLDDCVDKVSCQTLED